jgi:hypothetical protein
LDFQQIKQRIFTFKEPRAEPEFVLAWDEPTEIDEQTKKAASQTKEQYNYETAILPAGAKLTGNLEKDAGLIIEAFGGAENQSLGRRELCADGSAVIIFFMRHLVNPQVLANNIIEPLNGLERYNLKKISSEIWPPISPWSKNVSAVTVCGLRRWKPVRSAIPVCPFFR